MSRPVLPKGDNPKDIKDFRKGLYEDLYPDNKAWVPVTGNITSSSKTGAYVRMGRMYVFSVVLEAATLGSGAYFDLPISVSQAAVFSVSDGTTLRPGMIEAGGSRVYIPAFTAGRVVISGVVVN